ncbi:HAD family hydrolase [Paenibacillus pasadenensis]|uniref:5'-nucleotidase YjjG n=1 Tax=Paenibacillus pasadenensis TaxID=217090 RepID=A0A2N5N4V6_9BACL|nr:HAD family hydrolase [Paenibacillus pasadenensis]PLT45386.1 5'-nucleotidase YjjG [Paenibacillus pasadenensis]
MIRAILFDLDNTLLDRTAGFHEFACRFAERYAAVPESGRAGWTRRLIELDEDGYKPKHDLFRELPELLPCTCSDPAELMAFYEREYVAAARAMSGAAQLLASLRPYYRLGIVSNGKDAIQRGKLERTGLARWFESILVSESAGCRKPQREIFAMGLRELGVQPEQALFVGDHPVNDIQGAYFSGMKTVWLRSSQAWPDEAAALPDAVISELAQLPAAIRLVSGQTAAADWRLSSGA